MYKRRSKTFSSLKDGSIRPSWIILGLGNVGRSYEKSRHNFGFLAVEKITEKIESGDWKKRWNYFYSSSSERGIILAKPRTMMNLSGIAAFKIIQEFEIPPERMIVIYDDLDIPFWKIRVRPGGSCGGHKGILSISSVLNTRDFPRIRLGIQQEKKPDDTVSYVLGEFTHKEQDRIEEILEAACEAALLITGGKLQQAMNIYN
jgi:PTH1 family peptidyl-tRNA hydrolase